MSRKDHLWVVVAGRSCPKVEALFFDGHAQRLVAEGGEFPKQQLGNGGFVPGNRFNVDEFSSECNHIHGHAIENTR